MANDDVTKAMWHELRVNPPERITQEPFDRSDRHLRRLRRLVEGDRAEASDLVPYTQDLLYTAIQSDLFAYLLPFCLEAWRSNLRGTSSEYGGFVEYFYPVLARREILATHLTPRQQLVTSDFMRRAILDEIDAQRGLSFHGARTRVYRWFAALATHGVLFPETRKLWTDWWSLNTVGGAVASVQYISCLMYPETENPIFAPWTREEGGGPPCLWEFAGHLYTHCWLPQNVGFLAEALTSNHVGDVLIRATQVLSDQLEGETASQVAADLPLCAETLERRCSELPTILAQQQRPDLAIEWSE